LPFCSPPLSNKEMVVELVMYLGSGDIIRPVESMVWIVD
jgi:hypothetical protein